MKYSTYITQQNAGAKNTRANNTTKMLPKKTLPETPELNITPMTYNIVPRLNKPNNKQKRQAIHWHRLHGSIVTFIFNNIQINCGVSSFLVSIKTNIWCFRLHCVNLKAFRRQFLSCF